jgi:succinate dehydrogenase / fumarate reductase iron-sulfur subunit
MHHLPQGQAERMRRTLSMSNAMDAAGFGNCSNHFECEAACPKEIKRDTMALMYRDYAKASLTYRE